MKRKNSKRLIALLAAGVMSLGVLAGCTSTEQSNNTSSDNTKTQTETKTDTTAEKQKAPAVPGIEGWKPFEERVTMTVPVYDRSKEGYPAVDDNYWTDWVQKEFGDKWNIDVKYIAIPRSDVMTKYSLLIAAGDTPTIMMEYDYPKVTQWANDGAMAEISLDDFAQVAPTYYQKMVDNKQLDYTKVNGKDYFVLSERPYYDAGFMWQTFMRKDWLDQIGMDIPKSYEEFTKVIDAIQDAGLSEHPLGLKLPNAYVTNFPFRDYPVNEEEWVMYSSLGTASLSWEPTKKFLKRQNAEYNKEYYSPEYYLDTDGNQEKADFISGKLFQYGGYIGANVDWLKAFYENNPDAELVVANSYANVESGVVEHPQNRADNPFGMIVGFSSFATQEQLKAAWMYMEWMSQEDVLFTLENGIEGVTYTMGEDGIPVVDGNYRGEEMLNHNNNIDMTCVVHASKVLPKVEDSIKVVTPQGLPQDLFPEILKGYQMNKEIADKGWAYTDPIFAVSLESESEYNATLLNLYKEYSVRLVRAKPEEFDTLYEQLSQEYLDAGYQEIIDERLEAYKNGQTTKLPAYIK